MARSRRTVLLVLTILLAVVAGTPPTATALEVGEPAPNFRLTATTGGEISLSQYRGKQLVLIEFYSADFAPV